jgi:hypothetical protein
MTLRRRSIKTKIIRNMHAEMKKKKPQSDFNVTKIMTYFYVSFLCWPKRSNQCEGSSWKKNIESHLKLRQSAFMLQ